MNKRQGKITVIKEERLNKLISASGICSRRKADELILAAKVKVNGKLVCELGAKFPSDAKIEIEGKLLHKPKKYYILLNKPKDAISTLSDPENRKTVMDYIDDKLQKLVYPVGRLDRNTTGVLLLTNDGDLSYSLTHPSKKVKKVYSVTLNKNLDQASVVKLVEGVMIDDELCFFDKVVYTDIKNKQKVEVHIHSGKYHIIKIMFEKIGYDVRYLDRVSFAGIVKSDLKRGEWRHLKINEINMLKRC